MADRVGQQFGDYRLTRFLGRGSFGDVYLGEHVHDNTLAAIKVLQARLTPEDLKEFINEVSTTFRLQHPNIVRLLDFGIGADDTPFLAMDYAPNGTLRQRNPKGTRLPLDTIVTYIKHIAVALQYAHDKRRVHRDVKPDNILLGPNNEVLLSDFGIASVAHGTQSLNTQKEAGSVPYMAPEQLQGKPRPASDQYALGIIVYEWLCGERPFNGAYWEIVSQHLSTLPPPFKKDLKIPPEVEQVVMTALAKDPHHRFASIQAFANALVQTCQPKPPIGTTLLTYRGHIGGANSVAWSPDGRFIASGSSDGTVQIWDVTTGATILIYEGHSSSVEAVAWSPDSRHIASAGEDGAVHVWDAATGNLLLIYQGHSSRVNAVVWSHRGTRIASASDDETVQIWAPFNGRILFTCHNTENTKDPDGYETDDPVRDVTWSPDDSDIAYASNYRGVQVYNTTTGIITRISSDSVDRISWSPDSKSIACNGHYYESDEDGSSYPAYPIIEVLDAVTRHTHITYEGHIYDEFFNSVMAVAWSPDGRHIISAETGQLKKDGFIVTVWVIQVRDTAGVLLLTYRGHSHTIKTVTWSHDGKCIASGSYKEVKVWDVVTGNTLLTHPSQSGFVKAVAWSPDGKCIASAETEWLLEEELCDSVSEWHNFEEGIGTVQIWDAITGATLLTYYGHSASVNSVVWSPDGKCIASGSDDGTVQVWDATTGNHLFTYSDHTSGVNAVVWSPDGSRIASAGYGVRIWQAM